MMNYERIRALREDRDWTQQQVANLLQINRRAYCAYEKGGNLMSPDLFIPLAKIYETSVDSLFELTEYPHIPPAN